jgi:AraC-like DNA-binding protein
MTAQVHSVLVRLPAEPCATRARRPAPHLRPYVVGYGAFRAGDPGRRRVLPLSLITVVVDLDRPVPLLFGGRDTPMIHAGAGWRRGVAIGLTIAGARALLGTPMGPLTGMTVPLDDLLGRRSGELAERLSAAPDWNARFVLLDHLLTAWLRPQEPDAPATHGWRRLQDAGRITMRELAAELGVGRRRLETGFRREIGLSPKTVARIARFQRAVRVLGTTPPGTFQAAVACGYADQPHFNREVRAMAGITPTELRAFVQDSGRLTG